MLRRAVVVGAVGLLVVGVIGGLGVEPAQAASSCRTVPVPQDEELRSGIARTEFGVDGTGVTVGIISTTFAQTTAVSSQAQNIADGLLPGPGNPCGYLTPVEVALEGVPVGDVDDEGRGMAQIVHGVAPGARLVFASAQTTGGMPPALQKLREADVDIIVDDMTFYTDEPWFQQSSISQIIDGMVADGVTYFSAAANETVLATAPRPGQQRTPVNGWSTDAYRPTACTAEVLAQMGVTSAQADCMNFRTDGTSDPGADYIVDVARITDAAQPTATVQFYLQWAEPFATTTAEFELVVKVTGDNGTTWSIAGVDPVKPLAGVPITFDPTVVGDSPTIELSIVRYLGAAHITPPIAFLGTMNGPQWIASAEYWQSNEHDTVGRTIVGHNGAASVITVAATGIGGRERLESFSSLGPVTYTLEPQTTAGTEGRLPAPVTRAKPTLLSVDGIPNTVLDIPDGAVQLFYGTSAATPNAGAVAALALQLDPSISPARMAELLTRTARPQPAPYPGVSAADSVGAGLIDAHALLRKIAPKPQLARTGGEALWPLGLGVLLLGAGLTLQVRRRVRRG